VPDQGFEPILNTYFNVYIYIYFDTFKVALESKRCEWMGARRLHPKNLKFESGYRFSVLLRRAAKAYKGLEAVVI
jgi:hypothetical protein